VDNKGEEMKIPRIMILDRAADSQDEVINIQMSEDTYIIQALQDVTISLLDGDFPSGTLRFKAGQILMFPIFED